MQSNLLTELKDPLVNDDFLLEIDRIKEKELYARVTVLTQDENPIEFIEGRIISGSLNIDGSSTVRRSCSLSLIANDLSIRDFYWSLKSKFKLEIGIKNNINNNYPEIIWFPQGLFIFTTFATSIGVNNYTVNISGKDKMCLLNGELDGQLPHSIDFGKFDDQGTIKQNTIKEIIYHAMHVYGKEPYHNIIINDIEDYGVELLEFQGDIKTPIYLLKNDFGYINMTMYGDMECYVKKDSKWTNKHNDKNKTKINFRNLEDFNSKYSYDKLVDFVQSGVNFQKGTKIKLTEDSENEFTLAKISYGETAGYRITDLVYPGDLYGEPGETVTSILDKIKNMLGDFEYYYDVDGRFIFQRTKNYYSNPWTPIVNNENNQNDIYVESAAHTSSLAYAFHNSDYFTSISNNPQLANIKNDFSIWGSRQTVTGDTYPIHMRFSINNKPKKYVNYKNNCIYLDKTLNWKKGVDYQENDNYEFVDWREIMYQMASDYSKNNKDDDFYYNIFQNNPECIGGYTGYEQYYTDLLGFWRDIYQLPNLHQKENDPDKNIKYYIKNAGQYILQDFIDEKTGKLINSNSQIAFIKEYDGKEYYSKNNKGEYGLAIDLNKTGYLENIDYYTKNIDEKGNVSYSLYNIYSFKDNTIDYYYYYNQENFIPLDHWNKNVFENPSLLNFWIDFIDNNSDLEKYSIPTIGTRSKVISDDSITGIYFKNVPNVIFITPEEWEAMNNKPVSSGYIYIRINNSMTNFFKISSQGKSANDVLEELIYQHTYAAETINLSTIPIYHLQPNTRISIQDNTSGINGEYIINRISIPLNYNGTMSITANKAVEPIY